MAQFLGVSFKNAGHTLCQIYAGPSQRALPLANRLNAQCIQHVAQLDTSIDVLLIATPDDVIQQYAETLPEMPCAVLHTAGSLPSSALQRLNPRHASIWCIYSIRSENLPQHRTIPVVIESENPEAVQLATTLAQSFSDAIYYLEAAQKPVVHLGAVLANNFTNHLFAICEELLGEVQIPREILFPILEETVQNLKQLPATELQTGPALRGDAKTQERHLQKLKNHPNYTRIYEAISASIQHMYANKPSNS